jgi:methionine-rich copper-binding protein CopC
MRARRTDWLSITLLALLVSAGGVSAHSFPREQNPAAGATLTSAPSEVVIKFDAQIEKVFAKLDVLDSSGNNAVVGQPIYGSDGSTLSAKLAPLKPGTYTVKWAVVGADTHRTQGSYTFTVAGSG